MSTLSRAEIRRMKRIWSKVPPCPFLANRRCSIYVDRPLVCRLFGHPQLGSLRCSHGCTSTRTLTAKQGADLMKAMAQATNQAAPPYLDVREVSR